MAELEVFYQSQSVGNLTDLGGGRIGFAYAPEWAASPEAFPVSLSLPFSGGWLPGTVDHRWFSNLLPEGPTREALARELVVAQDNDFALLEKIGREVAGAFSIVPVGNSPSSGQEGRVRWVSKEELLDRVRTRNVKERILVDGQIRLSLAGAQSKWAVRVGDDGAVGLPQGDLASTHILKFADHRFAHVPHNEALISFITRQLGMDAVEVKAFEGYSLVARYDRVTTNEGVVTRLHQEDFCQALGLASASKYEGAVREVSLGHCAELLRRHSARPAEDIQRLLVWQFANLLLGNSDGHAKNLSILYATEGPRLAPFYDLVCTRAYKNLDRRLGLSIGGQNDPGQVRQSDIEAMAVQCQVRLALLLRILQDLVDQLDSRLDQWVQEYVEASGRSPAAEMVSSVVKVQCRRTATTCLQK